ncbi:site-specific integrase [Corynebacterium sp. CNJ-954]|uniref:tyrosine-type recombinase/integrase n=1 Tax=Corynebacterium sp. CNJ-954 TaxID=1904962 RepID=UPI0009F95537|nr:site-specific integrase [Corynebacterium sp. CNJ-954]
MSVQRRPPNGVKLKKGQRAKWVVRYRPYPGAKERSKTFTYDEYDAPEKAAKLFDADQLTKIAQGTWIDPNMQKITVGEIFERWMYSTPRRQATMDLYDNTLRLQLPPIADYPAGQVTTKDVTDWYTDLTTCRTWLSKDDKGLSPGTARDQLRRLRSAYRWAIDERIVTRSPVVIPKLDDDDTAVLTESIPTIGEIIRVIDCVREGGAQYTESKRKGAEPRTYAMGPNAVVADMMVTAMLTGLRINEICGLIVEDVNLDIGEIRLTRQMDVRTRKRGPLKSRAGRRVIPISTELEPTLRCLVNEKGPTDWIFRGANGNSMHSSRVAVCVSRAAKHCGAERVHFHSLRHFFASSLITAGRPIQDVSRVMGHSSASMTLDVYTHVLDRDGSGMRDAISSAIGCGMSAGWRHLKAVPETGS